MQGWLARVAYMEIERNLVAERKHAYNELDNQNLRPGSGIQAEPLACWSSNFLGWGSLAEPPKEKHPIERLGV